MNKRPPTFLLLFLLISFGSVSAVLFTPGLPQITRYFHIGNHTASLTVTWFLVGYAVGQLLYGPLANGYGRKVTLYIGIILEMLGSLLCALSGNFHSFTLLVVARLIMALGSSVGLKMSFTLVSDCYQADTSSRIISHLMMAFAITPSIGVAIGGFLAEHLGWQSCFYAMIIYGIFILYLTYGMQETAKELNKNALRFKQIYHNYTSTSKNRIFLYGAILMGCTTSYIYLFASVAPFIASHNIKLTPSSYGLWNLIPPLGVVCGSQLSVFCSQRLKPSSAIKLGSIAVALGTLTMLTAFALKAFDAIWLFLPITIIYVGTSFIFANSSALAITTSNDKSSASAVMNFINVGLTTLSVLIVGKIHTTSALLLPISYTVLVTAILSLTFLLINYQRTHASR